jgi:hypothetical protein|tara:strand:- start:2746 stop:3231 length:486 start_codon:yes stop_codon:yes gene_type:complete
MSEELVKIIAGRFNLSSMTDILEPQADLDLDRSNLDYEFGRQPSLVAVYGYLFAEAEAEESLVSLAEEILTAKKDKKLRSDFLREGTKITEKLIDKTLLLDDELIETKRKVIEAKKTKRLFKAAVTGLDHKLQALINAGATDRSNREVIIRDKDGFERKNG